MSWDRPRAHAKAGAEMRGLRSGHQPLAASTFRPKGSKGVVSAAFPLLLVSLFLIFSCLFEITPVIRETRPQLILAGIGLLILFTSGKAMKVVMTPVGKSLLMFTAWFLVCIPFAVWRGGSVGIFLNVWYKALLMFVLTAGLLSTVPQAKRLFHAIGYAVGLMATIALAERSYHFGRLELPNSRFGNSNELAISLLVGLTFLGYTYIHGSQRQRVLAAVLCAPVLLALVKTGSRGGFLGVVMLCAYAYSQSSSGNRLKMMAAVPFILIALAILVPSNLRSRYFTLFKSSGQGPMTREEYKEYIAAAGSAEARLKLLKDSVTVTVQHPLLGVGPGNFPVEQNNMAIARGEIGMWHQTHNSYTQVSSEMGIPGLILYVIFLYRTFKQLTSIVRNRQPGAFWVDLRALAGPLRASLVVLATVAMFDSFAYIPDVPIMAGLAVALGEIAQEQEATDSVTTAVARPGSRMKVLVANRRLA